MPAESTILSMLPTLVNITINTDSAIPVRDQLIEQIGWQIAAGVLKNNEKLPSIRALAQKLGIHAATVNYAYNKLSAIGMLEIRHGSGVRVAPNIGLGQADGHSDIDSLFSRFVSNASHRAQRRYC